MEQQNKDERIKDLEYFLSLRKDLTRHMTGVIEKLHNMIDKVEEERDYYVRLSSSRFEDFTEEQFKHLCNHFEHRRRNEKDNPIIDNRLACSYTFAVRLLSYATDDIPGCACGEDEKEGMMRFAVHLLEYQIKTATDENELAYLERCNAKERLKKAKEFLTI